ncbi:MAG TPA: lasso RiPP family leader peptide-containing protein [Chloroflexota bacterium]|jgi:hypothetical protein|nr:lasso RiPP family leader peptide-containing protein [Chloroflexota bacterium]
MKRAYRPPTLVEYGRLEQITAGQTGGSPDNIIVNGQLISVNNVCNPSEPHPGLICS